ncbi:hypothetical protein SUDANB95_07943 (plasmid) [Actinosynnema sp. ALI-1.44]
MITSVKKALLLGAALLTLAGCTGTGGDSAPPTAGSSAAAAEDGALAGLPEEYRKQAAAFIAHRKIDACGLHDVEAAKKVSGDQGDEIMPAQDGLQNCTLRLSKGEFNSTWTLYLEVGAEFDAGRRQQAAPETLPGGLEVFTEESDEKSCTLARPLDDEFAVELRVRFGGGSGDAPPKQPCAFAREYVTEMATLWNNPPQRGSGRTSPDLGLARLDPCKAAAAVQEEQGQGAELRPVSPYGCEVRLAPGTVKDKSVTQAVTVEFIMDEDPTLLVDNSATSKDSTKVTIGGHSAVITKRKIDCRTYVVWQPEVAVIADARSDDAAASVQQVSISTPTCDTAQATAEKIMAKVGAR